MNISNEMVLLDDPNLLTRSHAGSRNKLSKASVGMFQVIAWLWARGKRPHNHAFTCPFIHLALDKGVLSSSHGSSPLWGIGNSAMNKTD